MTDQPQIASTPPCDVRTEKLRQMEVEFQISAMREQNELRERMIEMKQRAFISRVPQEQIDADPTWLDKARSAVMSAMSKAIDPPPSMEIQLARLDVCRSCEQMKPSPNESLVGFCKKCGCGETRFSALTFKATIARSSCPLQLWDVASRAS